MPYILRVSRREPRGRSRPARYVAPTPVPEPEPEPEPIEVEAIEEAAPVARKAKPVEDDDG